MIRMIAIGVLLSLFAGCASQRQGFEVYVEHDVSQPTVQSGVSPTKVWFMYRIELR
jgi:hypothetical protein